MKIKYNTIICNFCGKEFNPQGSHLKIHNITNKEYYDKFLKETNEGLCLLCGNPTRFYTMKCGYKPYCSDKCAANSDILKNNKIQTCLKIHGCKYVLQNKEIRDKGKNTRLKENNGNYFSENSFEQLKNTNLEKYGKEFYTQTDEYKEQVKKHNNEKFGCDYYVQTEECREKLTKTCQDRFGCDYYTQTEKCKENRKKINLDEKTKNDIQNKTKNICFEKYGCEYSFQSENNKNKSKLTKKEKYGNENYVNVEKAEQTNLERYGYKHPSQSPNIDCSSHRFTYNGLNFDSNWELLYYKYLTEHNIEFSYKPKITLEFEYDGEIRNYKPDFIVEGKITEIKGDHFFKNGKMICPWKHKNDTLEKIEWRNGLFEAKHQCMLKNGVIILKQKELKELGIL